MPILGAILGQTAIKKPTGGYAINDNATRNKYYGYTSPKPVSAPKKTYTAPKPVYHAPAKTSSVKVIQAPKAPTPAPVVPATPKQPTLDELMSKYYGQSTNDVNSLYDKQRTEQLAQLKAQRDVAIGKINQQQTATKQDYYNQRNQADVVSAQNVQRLRELMAANGLSSSGENITANARANSDRQNSLNSLNLQEQAKMNDYASQIADWNNPARDQAITNQIEAARAQALLNAKQQAYQKAWNNWQFNNMSAAQQAQLAMSKYNTDSANAANTAASQAALDYYRSMGFNGSAGGGGTAQFQSDMSKAISRGVPAEWAPVLSEIVRRESSYNPNAKNPNSSAYGYGQFLSSTRQAYEKKTGLNYSDPVNQLIMMAQYVKDRYGNPQNALNFWLKNKWY